MMHLRPIKAILPARPHLNLHPLNNPPFTDTSKNKESFPDEGNFLYCFENIVAGWGLLSSRNQLDDVAERYDYHKPDEQHETRRVDIAFVFRSYRLFAHQFNYQEH